MAIFSSYVSLPEGIAWGPKKNRTQTPQGFQKRPPDPLQGLVKVPSKGHPSERAGPGATDVAVEAVHKGQGSQIGKLQMLQTVAKASTKPKKKWSRRPVVVSSNLTTKFELYQYIIIYLSHKL